MSTCLSSYDRKDNTRLLMLRAFCDLKHKKYLLYNIRSLLFDLRYLLSQIKFHFYYFSKCFDIFLAKIKHVDVGWKLFLLLAIWHNSVHVTLILFLFRSDDIDYWNHDESFFDDNDYLMSCWLFMWRALQQFHIVSSKMSNFANTWCKLGCEICKMSKIKHVFNLIAFKLAWNF